MSLVDKDEAILAATSTGVTFRIGMLTPNEEQLVGDLAELIAKRIRLLPEVSQ